jgi:hypothetical protein
MDTEEEDRKDLLIIECIEIVNNANKRRDS